MNFFLATIVLILFNCSVLSAKIINIENKIRIEVPSSHKFIKYDNEEVRESIEELKNSVDGMEMDLYLIGPSKYVDLEKAILDGEDPMENEYIQLIMKKLERKNFRDDIKAGKWLISEFKKIMKKEKIDFVTYLLISNKTLIEMLSEDDVAADMLPELQSMNNSELLEKTKEIKKEIATLDGANSKNYAVGPVTFSYNKIKIGKNENGNLFLKGPSKFFIAINEFITLDAELNVYLGEHDNKTYFFISSCYVDCSNFSNKFDKMINSMPSTNIYIKKKKNIKITNTVNRNVAEQLKALSELYQSGVLTKEEFTKAKKKILN